MDINNNQETILPPQPITEPVKRKMNWFWFAVAGTMLVVGLVILRFAGGVFVKEVIQEVVIEERTDELDIARGKPAPYFELSDLAGNKVKISDFLDQPLILTFWTTWNILSVDQLRILTEVEFPLEVQLQILAVNSQEDRSIVFNFVKRGDYDITVLLDESGAVGEMYNIQTLPVTYFIDKDGNVVYTYVGLFGEKEIVDKIGEILNR